MHQHTHAHTYTHTHTHRNVMGGYSHTDIHMPRRMGTHKHGTCEHTRMNGWALTDADADIHAHKTHLDSHTHTLTHTRI